MDLTKPFEDSRDHLLAVAYRMLGSRAEADDAVQEAWLRLQRTDTAAVDNLGGWLTTVVARICLDMLRSRKSRREADREAAEAPSSADPERDVLLADSIGVALLIVLETLEPAERVAFVLHDLFDLPFDEIAPIVGRNPASTRQLASRARRRVQGAPVHSEADSQRQQEVIAAFLAAARDGDLAGLIAVLDPEVVVRADAAAQRLGARPEVRGLEAVAKTFLGRAAASRQVLVDGQPGAAWVRDGQLMVAFVFRIEDGKIASLDLCAEPAQLATVELLD